MNPTIDNAFSNGDPDQTRGSLAHPGKSLASSLSPMRSMLVETDYGWQVELSPIRAFHALRIWSRLAADAQTSEGQEPTSLLFDVELAPGPRTDRAHTAASESMTLSQIVDRLGIHAQERFADEFGEQLVLDEMAQRELVGMIDTSKMRSVLVAGPIEPRDAHAIVQAVEAGHSALDVEFRAIASIKVVRDRVATLQTREKRHALLLVAENFRHYLAALRGRPAAEFASPQPHQIERLMNVTGSINVRAIETDVFSTTIDIGVSTAVDEHNVPADQSLIFDVPSNTWHDEP